LLSRSLWRQVVKIEAEFWKQDVEEIDREENILANERK
jgi:hypothetical protein